MQTIIYREWINSEGTAQGIIFKVCVLSRSAMSSSLQPHGTCNPSPPGSSVRGDSPGKNIGVGSHFLLQRKININAISYTKP